MILVLDAEMSQHSVATGNYFERNNYFGRRVWISYASYLVEVNTLSI